ncbi:hypothetical protein JB92DRAFT_1208344 [Gautieria morchelliformis]|nr:hypothetical protein JB92DRAFT_1208344 [Gautieria morchelliformis]
MDVRLLRGGMQNGRNGLGMIKVTHRLREYRPPTLGLEPGGCIELGTVRVYELAACNIVACTLVNAAYHDEEERRSPSSGEGFTMGAAAATVARRNPLTSEVKMTRMVSTSRVTGVYGADEEGGDERRACNFACETTMAARLRQSAGTQVRGDGPGPVRPSSSSRPLLVLQSDTEGPLQATVCPVGQLGSSERGSSSLTRTMRDSGREPQILGGSISWSPSGKLRRQSKGNRKGPGRCIRVLCVPFLSLFLPMLPLHFLWCPSLDFLCNAYLIRVLFCRVQFNMCAMAG